MAKLGCYYSLCPIIDQKSLMGINNDSQSGQVLVTLGRNIAIKYKLSDQKQLISWRTKDKFSSPIIFYAKEQKYCAVFNKSYLRLWDDESEQLDKFKKLKFNKSIYTLCNWSSQSFIVFDNGSVIPLESGLDKRKELQPVDILNASNERIIDVFLIENNAQMYSGLLIEDESALKEFVFSSLDDSKSICRIKLHKENASFRGCLLTTLQGNKIVLLTLWSDGKLFAYNFEESHEYFMAFIDSILCAHDVTLCALNHDYIILYGADNSQEGAVLLIFNVQFKITQCKQHFKMYASGTKIWCLESNVFLCVGQHLAVIPYHLHKEQLAALVGSHKCTIIDADISIVQELNVTCWDETKDDAMRKLSVPNERIAEMCKQGCSEYAIVEEVIPALIKANDMKAIKRCLDYFEDIPEDCRVQLLNYILEVDGERFGKAKNERGSRILGCLAPFQRCNFIDKILMKSFNDVALLSQLRLHLTLKNSLLLMRYICYLLSEDGHDVHEDVAFGERKLIDWGCVLLDANYQQILLTNDQHVVETLHYFRQLVKAHICALDVLQDFSPVVENLRSGRCRRAQSSAKYSIESINLYNFH